MNSAVVIDTNVTIVANDMHPAAGLDCVGACIDALLQARQSGVIFPTLDSQGSAMPSLNGYGIITAIHSTAA